jgi:hypothetical protein
MHTILVNLPIRTALTLGDGELASFGVERIFLDSIENWANVDVQLDIIDGSDDQCLLTYLRDLARA